MFHDRGYKPNGYTPIINARQLCDYVFTVTDNKNKFPEYEITEKRDENGNVVQQIITVKEDSFINQARLQAFQIYELAYCANEIDLRYEPDRKEERLKKQQEAIELCDTHLATMELLCLKYKQRKRMMHWGQTVIDVREGLKKWHKSDIERYASI